MRVESSSESFITRAKRTIRYETASP